MASKEIKQKIVLEGEKEYTKAIKDAQRNLRTLKSELKAETAELGANATAQQKNEVKVKSLKQQIKEQEEIVKTYQAALKEVTEKYGDNEEAMARWEQKLNDARTALANSRNEMERLSGDLGSVGTSMSEVTTQTEQGVVATKSFADALTSIGSGAEAVSSTIEGVFTSMLDTVRSAAQEVWQLISDTAAKANSWTDLANIWGTDAQEIQQWSRSLSAVGKDFSDLNTVINTIALGGKQKKITELLGVSDVNYKSDWEYALAVMRQIKKEADSGKDMTPIYEQIFGSKKSTTVMDLINNWEDIEKGLTTFNGDEGGFGLTTEELATMNDAWVQINTIQEKWQALKDEFAAGLGSVTLDIMANVSGGLDALNDFFNAETPEEREAALEAFRQNVEEAFRKVAEAIRVGVETLGQVGEELSESEDPVVAAIGTLLQSIADALQWFIDNQDAVKTALKAIFGTWLVAKLGVIGSKLASLIANIAVIKAFTGASTIAGVGSAVTASTTAGAAAAKGPSFFGSLGLAALTTWGVNEGVKALPANFMSALAESLGLGTKEEKVLDEYNKSQGIETFGDVEAKVLSTPQELNQRAMASMWDILMHPEKNAKQPETPAEEPKDVTTPPEKKVVRYYDEDEDLEIEEIEEAINPNALKVTPEQREAAESFWDAWRQWQTDNKSEPYDEASEALDAAFEGNEDVLQQLDLLLDDLIRQTTENDTWSDMENLPDWWFNGPNGETVTSSDLQGFRSLPGLLQAAVQSGAASGVSGISVSLDGYSVGRLVAPYVSQYIAGTVVTAI